MNKTKVSIQGLPGSFHEVAARKHFGNDAELLYKDSFEGVFKDLDSSAANYAVVASENSKYGKIYEVDELLASHKSMIIGTVELPIYFCVLGLKDSSLDKVQEIYSQAPAFKQCKLFLDTELRNAKQVEHYDTAGAAADVSNWNDPSRAALASIVAAEIYGLQVLASGVEDDHDGENITTFYVLATS